MEGQESMTLGQVLDALHADISDLYGAWDEGMLDDADLEGHLLTLKVAMVSLTRATADPLVRDRILAWRKREYGEDVDAPGWEYDPDEGERAS